MKTIKQLEETIRLSKVTKLDGIQSFSFVAGKHCPNAKDSEVCKSCYAMKGNYKRFEATINKNRYFNFNSINTNDNWVDDMIQLLTKKYDDKKESTKFFRWFDSGDINNTKQAYKILQVMISTPHIKHWLPTRSYKNPKIKIILEEMSKLNNVVVRYSSDNININTTNHNGNKSIVITPQYIVDPESNSMCEAYRNKDGKCDGCRKCWDKNIETILYPIH